MAFVKLEVARGSGRPSADVRVTVSDVRSVRQIGVIVARGVMDSMGVDIGAELDLHVGHGEDAGWLRLETASGRNGRKLGKLPQTQSGLAKFPVLPPLALAPANSTDVAEWSAEPGALTLRLPAAMRGGDAPSAPAKAAQPVARATPPVEPPKPAPQPAEADFADKVRAGMAAAKAAREAGVPLPSRPGSGKANKLSAPTEADAAAPDARDKVEAMQLLRKGRSVRDVAAEFGFGLATVAGWNDEIAAERAAKGRAA